MPAAEDVKQFIRNRASQKDRRAMRCIHDIKKYPMFMPTPEIMSMIPKQNGSTNEFKKHLIGLLKESPWYQMSPYRRFLDACPPTATHGRVPSMTNLRARLDYARVCPFALTPDDKNFIMASYDDERSWKGKLRGAARRVRQRARFLKEHTLGRLGRLPVYAGMKYGYIRNDARLNGNRPNSDVGITERLQHISAQRNSALEGVRNNTTLNAKLRDLYTRRIERNYKAIESRIHKDFVREHEKSRTMQQRVLVKLLAVARAIEALVKLPWWAGKVPATLLWMYKFADLTLAVLQKVEGAQDVLVYHAIAGWAVALLWRRFASFSESIDARIKKHATASRIKIESDIRRGETIKKDLKYSGRSAAVAGINALLGGLRAELKSQPPGARTS